MKPVKDMNAGELAAFTCSHLASKGIHAVLTGGSVVTIFSRDAYVSLDLDFIIQGYVAPKHLKKAMAEIGFQEQNRYFTHPDTALFVEFPAGPLSVGDEPIQEIRSLTYPTGTLRIISPTDSVKDRLAAWYHWKDRQALEQALLVALAQDVNTKEIERWSDKEGHTQACKDFLALLLKRKES